MRYPFRHSSRLPRVAFIGLLLSICACVSSAFASTVWDFRQAGSPETVTGGTFSLHRTFSSGGMSVDVSAWANTGTTPAGSFAGGYLGRYDTGLGVCNRSEAAVVGGISNCVYDGGLRNQVDNVGQQDLVLFVFSELQSLESITIDPWGVFDRDVSFWIGTVTTPLNLGGLMFASLGGIGFGGQIDSHNGVGGDPLTISLGGITGNALLIGALYPADGAADKFKIQSLVTSAPAVVPVPAAVWLLLSATGLLGIVRRRQLRGVAR